MTKEELLESMCTGEAFKEEHTVFRMVETPERLPSGQIWEHPHFLPGFEELVSCRFMRDSGLRDFYCFPMPNWDAEAEEQAQSQAPDERQRVVVADGTLLSENAIALRMGHGDD